MSNFEKNYESHIRELDGKIAELYRELDGRIAELYREQNSLDWWHDCDCEFCDISDPIPEETETRANEIKAEVKEIERFKEILTAHVERYKVKK